MSMLCTAGYHMTEALNHVGVDVGVWGNHDIDFGTEGALSMVKCSRFPWLGANVYLGGEKEPLGGRLKRHGPDWGMPESDSFSYNPEDGIHAINVGSTKVCFTSLTNADFTLSKLRKRFNGRSQSSTIGPPSRRPLSWRI
jgi:hypothetical protein